MTNQTFQDKYIDKIICGDNVEVMAIMPDECVDLVVTSPPYDDLRMYHGYTLDVPAMVSHLWRIMKPGGVIVWVVGDATVNGSETGTSFRQALMFMDAGFNLHDTMIYLKAGPNNPSQNRYHQVFEYMFVFSKESPRVFNPIKDRRNHYQRRGGGTIRQTNGDTVPGNGLQWLEPCGQRFNVWRISNPGIPGTEHPATFPESLAADHIISWSNEGDLVFDPMCGSGTTLKMAERLNRHWLGCDVSEEYCEISRERIRIEQSQLKLDLSGGDTSE